MKFSISLSLSSALQTLELRTFAMKNKLQHVNEQLSQAIASKTDKLTTMMMKCYQNT